MRRSPTYNAWLDMKQRCDNPRNASYKDYGGRGIGYIPAWSVFVFFLRDMGLRPERIDQIVLDRKDNNGNYCKENCRWTTASRSVLNRRPFSTNLSGIPGVFFDKRRNHWRVYANLDRERTYLYYGKDFFEACCRRKSWETSLRHDENAVNV